MTTADLTKALERHFITSIECAHVRQEDRASCVCGWIGTWQKSVGDAGKEWGNHLLDVLQDAP